MIKAHPLTFLYQFSWNAERENEGKFQKKKTGEKKGGERGEKKGNKTDQMKETKMEKTPKRRPVGQARV